MPTIDRQLISRLEKLARLKLSENEAERMTDDLSKILKMVEKLEELPTEGIEALRQMTEEMMPPRVDDVKNELPRAAVFQNAPQHDGLFFRVPKVK